ncbi:MAG: aspartate/tyrosine/aromatic aminotransferase, partial [Deltaproteobacteria bacterium]|nr:aspartate/tyrosine/aromatic aminotransferase [Deltaproteobacteria bacterium]
GTGALRLGGDFLKVHFPGAVVWISDPTWPNHRGVFQAAGLKVATYPYYDPATSALRLDEILAAMGAMARGDVVVLHACCHNPTGIDPTPAQWDQLIRAMEQRGLIPFVDFAYQGFGSDVDGDAYVVRALGKSGLSFLVAGSFSKNFGLYRERTGVLTVTAGDKPEMERVMSQVKAVARANYSNPPAHGGKVVELILSRPDLKKIWSAELDEMRDRIKQMRILFGETLKAKGVNQDFSFLTRQNGMFSFSGITKEQVGRLKSEFGVYLVDNGRINVAGMTTKNMDRLCGAIAKVL